MSPVLSGGTISIPTCEIIVGPARCPSTIAPVQLVARTTTAAGEPAGSVVKDDGTRAEARAKSTGPTPANSVHCEKSTVNPRGSAQTAEAANTPARVAQVIVAFNNLSAKPQ